MPYINVKTNAKLDDERKQALMKKLSESISTLPGKSEAYLMCAVEDNTAMMFRGDASAKVAMVEVKIFGSAPKSAYEKLTSKICDIMSEEAGVDGNNCYVKYDEVENWGMDGFMF